MSPKWDIYIYSLLSFATYCDAFGSASYVVNNPNIRILYVYRVFSFEIISNSLSFSGTITSIILIYLSVIIGTREFWTSCNEDN